MPLARAQPAQLQRGGATWKAASAWLDRVHGANDGDGVSYGYTLRGDTAAQPIEQGAPSAELNYAECEHFH